VGTPSRETPGLHESAASTLGDLLYVDTTRTPVSEKDWVGLVQSIAARDQRALHALYEQTYRLVYTLSVRIVNSRETAEEVTLDVFHDVWRRAARSRAIDRLRFEQRKKRVHSPGDAPPAVMPVSDPREVFDVREQGRLLRDALEVLTPDERQAIETAFFAELTYDQVATRLNQPLGTVKTRVRSALGKLRQALAATVKGR
jgi:RNA polymerase sigma-70 factor, ECF subfamily